MTSTTKATIDRIVALVARTGGRVSLYREASLSGLSETLRWHHEWLNRRTGYPTSDSGRVLSMPIRALPDGSDDPRDLEKYERLCTEAEEYFRSLIDKKGE
jgi:hypothetical protein